MGKAFTTILLALLCCSEIAYAKRYSCPDGTVQYTPCTDLQMTTRPKYFSYTRQKKVPVKSAEGKVLGKRFQRLSTVKGLWEGFVASIGTTHLKLVFIKNGSIVESRYIGSVTRTQKEKPTKFKFISALPQEKGLSWQIIAQTV